MYISKKKFFFGENENGERFFQCENSIIIFTGGKHSLPSGLPTQYYHGYIGCIKKVKMFRRKLDLLRHGDNTNLKLCDT